MSFNEDSENDAPPPQDGRAAKLPSKGTEVQRLQPTSLVDETLKSFTLEAEPTWRRE